MFIYKIYLIILICCFSLNIVYCQENAKKLYSFEINDLEIIKPLGNFKGDELRGRKLVSGRKANCLACHKAPIEEEGFHGNFGPSLYGVGSRLNKGEIRLILVNSKLVNYDSIMPAYYSLKNLNRVIEKYKNKTILEAQEIEDIVEYLYSLKVNNTRN